MILRWSIFAFYFLQTLIPICLNNIGGIQIPGSVKCLLKGGSSFAIMLPSEKLTFLHCHAWQNMLREISGQAASRESVFCPRWSKQSNAVDKARKPRDLRQERRRKVSRFVDALVTGHPRGPFLFSPKISLLFRRETRSGPPCACYPRSPVSTGDSLYSPLPGRDYISITLFHDDRLRRRQWRSVKFKLEFHEVSRSSYSRTEIHAGPSQVGHNYVGSVVLKRLLFKWRQRGPPLIVMRSFQPIQDW